MGYIYILYMLQYCVCVFFALVYVDKDQEKTKFKK